MTSRAANVDLPERAPPRMNVVVRAPMLRAYVTSLTRKLTRWLGDEGVIYLVAAAPNLMPPVAAGQCPSRV